MRLRTAIAICALPAIAFLSMACDTFVSYTVVNETHEPVTAWILYRDCSDVTGYRGDYAYERTVPPGQTVEVSDITGPRPRQPWCLQIVDEDRRLLLSRPYDENGPGSYVVTPGLQPSTSIPEKSDLTERPWLDRIWRDFTNEPLYLVFYIFGIALWAGLAVATFATLRHFYRRYVKKQPV